MKLGWQTEEISLPLNYNHEVGEAFKKQTMLLITILICESSRISSLTRPCVA